jgi:hypothetical protein
VSLRLKSDILIVLLIFYNLYIPSQVFIFVLLLTKNEDNIDGFELKQPQIKLCNSSLFPFLSATYIVLEVEVFDLQLAIVSFNPIVNVLLLGLFIVFAGAQTKEL